MGMFKEEIKKKKNFNVLVLILITILVSIFQTVRFLCFLRNQIFFKYGSNTHAFL